MLFIDYNTFVRSTNFPTRMKQYMIALGILFPILSWAQSNQDEQSPLSQGQVHIGVGVGAGFGNKTGGYLRATPYANYFIKNGLALRLEGRFNYNGPGGNHYTGLGIGTQYHFLRTNRFSAFAQAGYFYGRANYGQYQFADINSPTYQVDRYRRYQFNYGMLNVGVGAQYQLGSRWSVNALVERNFGQKVGRWGADRQNATIGVGFRIK